jgi:LmbE family N-acetylglucosaminyl deacetylase
MSHHTPDHFIDVTDTFDKKIAALKAHVSQTAHNPNLENMIREWGERNAKLNGLPDGRVAEIFRIVSSD